MRSYALLLASAASAYPVAPRRALRINALRAAPEVSEQQSWMIDYMAKAHTARLEAVEDVPEEDALAALSPLWKPPLRSRPLRGGRVPSRVPPPIRMTRI